jgi:hypothetical protein
MVKFNELRITPDGRYLIIDVSVRSQPYYDNVYLKSISIDTQDTYKDGGPSTSIIYFKDISQEGDDIKTYRLELSVGDFLPSLSNNMFFIYVQATGTPTSDTPCGMDNEYTLGVTFNPCALYNSIMAYTKEIYNSCSIPKNFINLFLQFKALETSINTDHYAEAIELYNKFIKDLKPNAVNVKTCSCNG